MLQRALSAFVLIPLVLSATYVGGIWFFLLVTIAALIAGLEFFRLMRIGGYHPLPLIGMPLILLFLLDARVPGRGIAGGGLALATLLALAWQVFQANAPGSLLGWCLTVAGAVYVGWLSYHFVALRSLGRGLAWILLTFAVTWVCDSAAYFVGRWKGRRPFFPKISPNKTLEGGIAGLLAGTATGLIAGSVMGLSWYHSLALGTLGSLGATFGDLGESVIKRQIGIKDSGSLIPGHGGMLDRIDSLLFNTALVYYYAYWVLGAR